MDTPRQDLFAAAPPRAGRAVPRLGLWDAVSLIVGIIIGVGIFQTPSSVFSDVPYLGPALVTWLAGGVLALVGALCFAELSSAYPRSGGEYIYLTRAYGPLVGFVFAWTQLTIIRPASIGAVAYIFAIQFGALTELGDVWLLFVALAAIAALTAINIIGVTFGTSTQNVLTVLKVLGLVGILAVGLGWGDVRHLTGELRQPDVHPEPLKPGWFASAMILVLWTYAGWHEAAYIASEVRDNRRNLPLALVLGTSAVAVLYMLVNIAFVLGLGVDGAKQPTAAADLASLAWPEAGGKVMAVLIMVSALGALNGMIFTTARIAVAFGEDHTLFSPLTRWSPSFHTPTRALLLEGAISIIFVLGVFLFGPALTLRPAGLKQDDPFEHLIDVTAAVFWSLFLLTGITLFVLRRTDPQTPRPFPVPGYPVVPLVFCLMCAYMLVGSVLYRPEHSLAGFGITLIGLPLYFVQKTRIRREEPTVTV